LPELIAGTPTPGVAAAFTTLAADSLLTTLTATAKLPTGTITVGSTTGFATSGTILVGTETVAYTATTGTTFTGCTGGTKEWPSGTPVGTGKLTLAAAPPTSLTDAGENAQFRVLIDSEYLLLRAPTAGATTVTVLERGAEGSTAAPHSKGASVTNVLTRGALMNPLKGLQQGPMYQQLKAEVKAASNVVKLEEGSTADMKVGDRVSNAGNGIHEIPIPGLATIIAILNSTELELSYKAAVARKGILGFLGPSREEVNAEMGAYTLGIIDPATGRLGFVRPLGIFTHPQESFDNIAIGPKWPKLKPGENGGSGAIANIAIGGIGTLGPAPSGSGGALEELEANSCNIGLGGLALYKMKNGSAGLGNEDGSESGNNIGIGCAAGEYVNGANVIAIGVEALRMNSEGCSLVAVGYGALKFTQGNGRGITGIGNGALRDSGFANHSTALGQNAGRDAEGEAATLIGFQAGFGPSEETFQVGGAQFTLKGATVKCETARVRVGMYASSPTALGNDARTYPREGHPFYVKEILNSTELVLGRVAMTAAEAAFTVTETVTFYPKLQVDRSTGIGTEALTRATPAAAPRNTALGYRAGSEAYNGENLMLGYEAGMFAGTGNIVIGRGTVSEGGYSNTLRVGVGGANLLEGVTTAQSVPSLSATAAALKVNAKELAFYSGASVPQPKTTGTTEGFAAGTGTAVNSGSTFTGNTGIRAYTIGDMVKALKEVGLLASGGTYAEWWKKAFASSLISSWRLNDASGTSAADSTSTRNGTIVGGVTLARPGPMVEDPTCKAMKFNGTTGFIEVPNAAALEPAELTICALVYVEARAAGMGFVCSGEEEGSNCGFALGQDVFPEAMRGLEHPWGMQSYQSGTWLGALGGANPLLNRWQLVIGTYNGASLKLYVGETLVGEIPAAALKYSKKPLRIGRGHSTGQFLNGQLSEVFLLNKALTTAQVKSLYGASREMEEPQAEGLLLGVKTLGNVKASPLTLSAGKMMAIKAEAPNHGTVHSITLKVASVQGFGPLWLGIFADNAGTPGALLGQGTTTMAGAEQLCTVSGLSITLAKGASYWLGAVSSTSLRPVSEEESTATENFRRSTTNEYATGLVEGAAWNAVQKQAPALIYGES
jgi:hypothetical protein